MTDSDILTILKGNLELVTSIQDQYLGHLIQAARAEIRREGIILDTEDAGDVNILVMYAAYLYRKRANDGADASFRTQSNVMGMPRMLRYALNNRLFAQKAKADDV